MVRRRTQKWNFKLLWRLGKRLLKIVFKAVPFGFTFGVASFVFFGVRQMLHADPYFQVERIAVFPSGLLATSEYQFLENQARGQSLLELDLKRISRSLERNPKIKRAEVVRILPNQLNVFLATRAPFIQVQLKEEGPYYLVSSDQLVVSVEEWPKPDLMVLEDLNSEKKTCSIGTLYQNKHFRSLFNLLEFAKTDPSLNSETISKLAMDQLGNVTLILNDGIELKTGEELALSGSARAVLKSLLKSKERSQILYIDLRYRDLIVKKKDATVVEIQKVKTKI